MICTDATVAPSARLVGSSGGREPIHRVLMYLYISSEECLRRHSLSGFPPQQHALGKDRETSYVFPDRRNSIRPIFQAHGPVSSEKHLNPT